MIREDNKKSVVKSQMRGSTLKKEQQDAVANKAQRDEKTGRWYVNTINGGVIPVSDVQKKDLDNIVSDNKDEAAVQYAQSTLSFVQDIEATTKEINSKLGVLSFDNFGETVNQSNKNTLDYYTKNINNVISAMEIDRKAALKAQEKQLKGLEKIADNIIKALKIIENPYEDIDMDKEQQKMDLQIAQNQYRRYIKGRMDDEKFHKTVAVNAMERGGDSGWNWWKNRLSALVQNITNSNEELDRRARATGYIDKDGKPVAIDEETITLVHDGTASIARSDPQDKVIYGNGEPITVAVNKVTPVHDGTASIARSDPQDSAIFAKTGGPFDTLFNGIFGRIDEIYNSISNNSVVPSEPIGKSQFISSDVSNYEVNKLISANELANQMSVNTTSTEITIKPVEVKLSGSVRLETNGQSIDIMDMIDKNPMLIRQLSQMISDEVGKSINGGRSVTQYDYLRK